MLETLMTMGGFRGGGGRVRCGRPPPLPPQGFDPLPTQRVPLCTILRYPFLVTDTETFIKAPMAPIYTNFEGEARQKKPDYLVKISKKSLKRLFGVFFFIFLSAAQNIWMKQGLFTASGDL